MRKSTPRLVGLILLIGISIALAGCASIIPNEDNALPTVPIPANWTAESITNHSNDDVTERESGTEKLSADWWQRFGDTQLTALVSRALEANTDLRSAQAALREARALRNQVAAGLLPTVTASASAQRSKSAGTAVVNTSNASFDVSAGTAAVNTSSAGLDASWEPDVFGRTRAAVAAADANVRASEASLAQTRVAIAAEVAAGYIELRGHQAQLDVLRKSVARWEETLQLTRWRQQAGLTTSLDVEQARTSTEQTRAQIPALETSIAQGKHGLAVLTGNAPAVLDTELDRPAPVPLPPGDLALSIPAQTLRQRPDVAAAEEKVSAAAARVTQADAARYPSFNLTGSIGLSALTLSGLTGAAVGALLASVSIPVFDGGKTVAVIDAKQAGLDQARVSYQATVLAALRDVEDALAALAGARQRLSALRQAAEAADNAARLADVQYQGGLVDFQTALDTQRTLLSAQDSVASTESELAADYVRLYKALGGGWERQLEQDPKQADEGHPRSPSIESQRSS